MIIYKELAKGGIAVFIENRRVGTIKGSPDGWQYFPKGQTAGGELFKTLDACKKSLFED